MPVARNPAIIVMTRRGNLFPSGRAVAVRGKKVMRGKKGRDRETEGRKGEDTNCLMSISGHDCDFNHTFTTALSTSKYAQNIPAEPAAPA